MKRFISFFLLFSLFFAFFSCANDDTNEKVSAHLTLPMDFDCTFVLGEIDAEAHVKLTEDALSLGITDGDLTGLVISSDDKSTRFLYDGADITFSADTTKKFTYIREVFTFLRSQEFLKKHANETETEYVFTFLQDKTTLEYTVSKQDYSPRSLTVKGETTLLKLNFI